MDFVITSDKEQEIEEQAPVEAVEQPAVEQPPIDLISELNSKYGTSISQDDITSFDRFSKVKGNLDLLENETVVQIGNLIKQGLSPIAILEGLSIDADSVAEETLLFDYEKAKHPYLNDEDVQLIVKNKYLSAEEMQDIREFDNDRYVSVAKDRHDAITAQRDVIKNRKIELLTPSAPVESSKADTGVFSETDIEASVNNINNTINNISSLDIGGELNITANNETKSKIASHIAFSGSVNGEQMVVLKGVELESILKAMILSESKDDVSKAIKDKAMTMSNEAARELSKTFNTSGTASMAQSQGVTIL